MILVWILVACGLSFFLGAWLVHRGWQLIIAKKLEKLKRDNTVIGWVIGGPDGHGIYELVTKKPPPPPRTADELLASIDRPAP